MSIIDRILKNLSWIGEMSSYGIIQIDEETSDEFHISDDESQENTTQQEEH